MTTEEGKPALAKFGYNNEEARFLSAAALHSGYFLRRQFLRFVHGQKGWKDVLLIKKLMSNDHCRVTALRHERMVYHLCAKPLYDALGDPDNRNRREHQPSTIKTRIMALDFIFEHPKSVFLSTEREKVDYFAGRRGISATDLPTKLYASSYADSRTPRHFIEPFPVSIIKADGSEVVHFCYVDEGQQTTDRFATYLTYYRRLFRAIDDFHVVYAAENERLFPSAHRVFDKFLESNALCGDSAGQEREALLAYFKRRRAYEEHDFSDFDTAALIRLREEKHRFTGELYEQLYDRWKAGKGGSSKRFSTYVLDHDYGLFGTLTSRRDKRRNAETTTQVQTSTDRSVGFYEANHEGNKREHPGRDPAERR